MLAAKNEEIKGKAAAVATVMEKREMAVGSQQDGNQD
jgi:hypothetical protein